MSSVGTHRSPSNRDARTRIVGRTIAALTIVLFSLPGAREARAQFSNFTPLPGSVVGGSLSETQPLLLSSPLFVQSSISANDRGSLNGGVKLGDNWDMQTFNENGPQAGRFLFAPYETGTAGVRRFDLTTGQSVTIVAEGAQGFVAGDGSRWTPWGTYLTTEESWGAGSTKGRLFEITNPLADPASVNFVHRSILPRVSHEGLSFDKFNNLYFIDEFNGGSVYKYTSTTPNTGGTFFTAGQTFVLKVGAGALFEETGAATWVPITNVNGVALPGIPTIDGTTIDGRAAADVVGGTGLNRPEDIEIQTLADGTQRIYFGTTDTHKVFALNVTNPAAPSLNTFFDQLSIDAATGFAVGNGFLNPDNIAIDSFGNIYVVEDIGNIAAGGLGFDIWFAFDANRDGIAEKIGRWASLSTVGAEPTGLYFSPFDPNVAYLNVQHTGSDVDRLIQITATPEPGSAALALIGLGVIGAAVRRKRSLIGIA